MNFQSIRYFLQVARKRSFSQAAEELFITQQTLSASIASLEKELGCKLFVRHIPLELTYGASCSCNTQKPSSRIMSAWSGTSPRSARASGAGFGWAWR